MFTLNYEMIHFLEDYYSDEIKDIKDFHLDIHDECIITCDVVFRELGEIHLEFSIEKGKIILDGINTGVTCNLGYFIW